MAAISPSDVAIRNLSADPNRLRIKKLLLYACRHTWESNPASLEQIVWHELVDDVLAIAPTQEYLDFYLNSVVQTINKRAEYMAIAKAVVQHFSPLYLSRPKATLSQAPQSRYQSVARLLDQDPDALRLKKLLYCACKHVWENDPRKLNYFPSATLVEELYHQTLTPDNLNSVLWSIVRTLNRAEVYQAIAEKISNAFQLLYQHSGEPSTGIVVAAAPAATPAPPPSRQHQPADPPPSHSPTRLNQAVVPPEPAGAPEPAPRAAKPLAEWLTDLFDLRSGIMTSANPFRAKILLYGVLHRPPAPDQALWDLLKHTEIDDLLRILFRTHRVFSHLDTRLHEVAAAMPESAQYGQTVQALLRLFRPLYSGAIAGLSLESDGLQPTASPDAPPAQSRSEGSAPIRDSQAIADSEGQETCQFPRMQPPPVLSAEDQTLGRLMSPPPAAPSLTRQDSIHSLLTGDER